MMATTSPLPVLVMDAGQTGVRAELTVDDRVLLHHEGEGVVTDRPVVPQLAAMAREVLDRATAQGLLGREPVVLAVGSSGLTPGEDAGQLAEAVGVGVHKVLLAHDSITSYLGALGDRTGVVVAAGTGVVTLAVGDEQVARVDGWGNLIGDAGSGYWIGRASLDAVMRAHDGRGPATALSAPVQEHFDGDLEGAYMVLQADPHRVRHIAAWSRTVAELAADDEVCRDICERAGQELACSALAGLRRVGLSGVGSDGVGLDGTVEVPVGMVGKVFDSPHVRESFTRTVQEQCVGAWPTRTTTDGLRGAARLPLLSPGSALRRDVGRAGSGGPAAARGA
ncbi:N-acetylglucosamine kinase [Luteococcus sp.]|uniref:N-acetylglucosamine kinase n=1 Tax=Luteococcus sp. TaxID=1969402 RepID=UPI003736FD50